MQERSRVKAVTEYVQLFTALAIGIAAGIRLNREVHEARDGVAITTNIDHIVESLRKSEEQD